jgi:hypothetical protein
MPTAIENLDVWMKIESDIHSIYPNFLHNLTAKHATLSNREIKICMLTLLKCKANEIAEIMQIKEVHAVHMAVSRLCEHFGMGDDEPLVVYLLKLAL